MDSKHANSTSYSRVEARRALSLSIHACVVWFPLLKLELEKLKRIKDKVWSKNHDHEKSHETKHDFKNCVQHFSPLKVESFHLLEQVGHPKNTLFCLFSLCEAKHTQLFSLTTLQAFKVNKSSNRRPLFLKSLNLFDNII